MKTRLFFLLLWLAPALVCAQADYKTAVGVRLGAANGVSVKHFVSRKNAVEGILSTRWRGLGITGLYEVHGNAFQTRALNWYIGGGGHVYFWQDGPYRNPPPWWDNNRSTRAVAGLDGILGLEYTIPSAPINFALDWKPALNLVNYQGFWADEFAFSVRFAIK